TSSARSWSPLPPPRSRGESPPDRAPRVVAFPRRCTSACRAGAARAGAPGERARRIPCQRWRPWAAQRRAALSSLEVEMSQRSGGGSDLDRVLIGGDDAAQRLGLQQLLRGWGFTAEVAVDGRDALEKLPTVRPTIVLSDLVMPRMGGLELLTALMQEDPDVTMVLMTGQGTVESAVAAIKQGAYDYLSKPIDPQRLKILLDQIVARHDTLREVRALRRQLQERGTFGKMIGVSREMKKVYQMVEQAAPTSASILVTGESGTGKELVAQTVHQLSQRASQPFVPLNCAAIPDTLLESELFG